jgi:hypothetical protein
MSRIKPDEILCEHSRREFLMSAQRAELLALPTNRQEICERYSITPADVVLIDIIAQTPIGSGSRFLEDYF